MLCSVILSSAQVLLAQSFQRYPLIPYPQQLTVRDGYFAVNRKTQIVADESVFSGEIKQLRELVGMKLKVVGDGPSKNFIQFKKDTSVEQEEGYVLNIDKDKIIVCAKTNTGIFRAIETIRQLLPDAIENISVERPDEWRIPAVFIKDYPAYGYRGMHLDVARHFFSLEYLRKFIDRLALYKFNRLHLHLTDDEAWRIEIKKYPKLTEEGAWRSFDAHDSACIERAKATGDADMEIDPSHIKIINGKKMYGGFYTQEEMKELVRYAKARHIDIVPELDMPGHSRTAIRLYPFLACSAGKETGQGFSIPMCPCNENSFTFAENVYSEIFKIFPYEYVHLGADEVNKESWAKSPECVTLMEKERLNNVEELQSYFVRRMEKFFNAHGKKLIGWDEILEGGVTPSAIVMYWRSWVPKAPVEAAKHGNKVIMTPGNPLYFDAIPDKNALMNVYHFNPIPKNLTTAEAANIIGAQANIWTEYIPTTNRLEYMVYPRMLALAEVLWTDKTDDTSFLQRLNGQYKRMDALHIHYRLPDVENILEQNVFIDADTLDVHPPMQGLSLHYTTGESVPTLQSPVLDGPLIINRSITYKIAAFTPMGLRGQVYAAHYEKEALFPALPATPAFKGVHIAYFKSAFKRVAGMNGQRPDAIWDEAGIRVPDEKVNAGSFGLQFTGYVNIPAGGVYSFYLTSDDGSVLKIDDRMIIDNDGLHSAAEKNGQAALQKGVHKIELDFIEGGGGYKLQLQYSAPFSKDRNEIPAAWFD